MEEAAVTVCAPFAGTLEWAVAAGAQLEASQLMGWLSVRDHCALRALIAPTASRLSWRRSDELSTVQAGTPLALLGEGAEALQQCQRSEREDALHLHAALSSELNRLQARHASPLSEALLEPEARKLAARIERLRDLWLP